MDCLLGNANTENLLVKPSCGFMRIDANDPNRGEGQNRLGADLAQIYFPAKWQPAISKAYDSTSTLDPWHRPSRYAPLLHLICRYTLCQWPYGWASLFHVFFQLGLFLWTLHRTLLLFGKENYFQPCCLFCLVLIFLTPSGLSWFERGQYSFYLATGYLWFMSGLLLHKNRYFLYSALFGFIKWTSLVFYFMVFLYYLMQSFQQKNEKNRRNALNGILIFTAVFFSLFLFTYQDSLLFIQGALEQESNFLPTKMSLYHYLPSQIPKFILPLLLPITALALLSKPKSPSIQTLPFGLIVAFAVYAMLHPTLSYDYNGPILLAFIPLLLHNLDTVTNPMIFGISQRFSISITKNKILLAYASFCILFSYLLTMIKLVFS